MYRVSASAGGIARPRRPSQRRIWLGALATVIVSLGAGATLAATHLVVVLAVPLPLTFLLVMWGLALVVAAVVTAILGGACPCGAAMTTSALFILRQPPIRPTSLASGYHLEAESDSPSKT